MLKPFTSLLTLSLLFAAAAPTAKAQTYMAPNAPEFPYGDPNVANPMTVSSYSFRSWNTATAFGLVDVYLAAWANPEPGAQSEVTWQFANPGTTGMITNGSIPYFDVADLEVAAVQNFATGNTQILVAYYRNGAGHFLDIYDITSSPGTPVVYNSTMLLSGSSNYGRIRMDASSVGLTEVAIVWDYPGIGLQTMVGQAGSWSGVTDLAGTAGETGPDVAFNRTMGGTDVHYVYHDIAGTTITESIVPYLSLMGSPGSITPAIEDINTIPVPIQSRLVLDCPDDYNVRNWAYTYTDQNLLEVFVRYVDHNTTGMPDTKRTNAGFDLGNIPTYGQFKVFSPTLHYGYGDISGGGASNQINVAWYAAGSFNGYIGLEMKADGSGLVGAGDYWMLPNASTPTPIPNLPKVTSIAYSKGDLKYAPDYLYAAFHDYDPASGLFTLHHTFHKWADMVFKGTVDLKAAEAGIYPNPFRDVLHTSITLEKQGVVKLELLDITGKVITQKRSSLEKGVHDLEINGLQAYAPGTYLLRTSLDGTAIGSKIVVKQ